MGRGWKNFEMQAGKVFIAVKAQLRVILMRAQKENKQAVVKASMFLEKI